MHGDKDAKKLNNALMGTVMTKEQISVANEAEYALEEKNADQALLEKDAEYLQTIC